MVTDSIVEEELPRVERNPWADNFFRPLLLTIMVMCFNVSLVNLVRLLNPAWRGTYFLIGMLLVTVEAIYSYRILKLYRPRGTSIWRYRTTEGVVLILILKVISYANKPMAFIVADLQAMWQNPLNVVSLEFYVMLLLALVSWTAATNTIADFEALYDPFTFRVGRIAPLERLTARFFWGGIFLVFISGVSQLIVKFGLSSLIDFQRPSLGGIIINVLVYFALGLVLLSQANLARLMMSWRIQRIKIGSGLIKQWAKYGLIFLGLITLVVFFLPTGYTMGFLTSAAVILNYAMNILAEIFQLLLFLIFLPFILLFSLLLEDAPRNLINLPPQSPLVMDASAAGASVPWWEALRSLIFWLLALAIVWYLVKVYLSERPELLQSLKRFKSIGLIVNLLKQLWQWLTGVAQTGFAMMSERIKLPGRAGATTPFARGWNWFGLRRLSARERILYYYFNILKRVEKLGPARKPQQTPYEYEPELGQTVPEAQTEVHTLTDVFVRARYSREGFDEEQATSVKQQWQRIRQALRSLTHSASRAKKSEERK
jgi:hypothetical protein